MWFWDKNQTDYCCSHWEEIERKKAVVEKNEFLVYASPYIDDFSWFHLIFQEKLFTVIKTIFILRNLIVGDN